MVLTSDIAGNGLNNITGLTLGATHCCSLAGEEFARVAIRTAKVGDIAIA